MGKSAGGRPVPLPQVGGGLFEGTESMTRGPWHVAVLMGGWSAERPVSLSSGEGVAKALESRGHRVTRIDMDRDVALRLSETRPDVVRSEEHTSELQSLMRISYAVFCLKKKNKENKKNTLI